MHALVLLADGFEEVEGLTQIDFLRRGGIKVTSASITETRKVKGAHAIFVGADAHLKDLNPDDFDIVVLPGGGTGMQNLHDSQLVTDLLKKFYQEGKWLAAICASPSIFGDLGFVNGRSCVCYPGFENHMTGGKVANDNVVVDGKIITSKGPGTSLDFALKMIEVLVGKEKADEVAAAAQYQR